MLDVLAFDLTLQVTGRFTDGPLAETQVSGFGVWSVVSPTVPPAGCGAAGPVDVDIALPLAVM